MQPDGVSQREGRRPRPGEKLFTPESANRALVLVRRIVQDIAVRHERMLRMRQEREELAVSSPRSDRLEQLQRDFEQLIERLNELHEELREIGCELKDWSSGLVDFPALHHGRLVYLCWKLGEDQVSNWHEVYAGFSGRQPVPEGFGKPRTA